MPLSPLLRVILMLLSAASLAAAENPPSTLAPWALAERDVVVRVRTAPETDDVGRHVTVTSGPEGSQFVSATIVNRSERNLRLSRVELSFPWEPQLAGNPKAKLTAGGSAMFDLPAIVGPATKPVSSRMYVMSSHGGAHAFAGLVTWRTIWTTLTVAQGRITAAAEGEDRILRPGETLRLERLWLAHSADWQGLLFRYGDMIAAENRIRLKPDPRYVGWSNWDYYGSGFNAAQIRENMAALVAMNVGANLIQMDGGWWSRCGDYLTPRENLGAHPKDLAAEIRARGMTAGIHFDGMRADFDSRVVTEHPEFFLKDGEGALLRAQPSASGKPGRVFWDFSHPGARAYMRDLLRVIRREWGYDYFKFDFLKFTFPFYIARATGIPLERLRVVAHDPGLTSVERSHLALAAFREGIGDDAYFVACTAEFGPVLGHADALRTGGDIDPTYSRFSRSCMENGGSFFLHRRAIHNDADYHVGRAKEDEDASLVANPRKTGGDMSVDLARMWTHYVGLFGGPKISGDNLTILRDERKALFREAIALPGCERYVPLDFWQRARDRDDPFAAFLGESGGEVYLALFNWSDAPRELRVGGWQRNGAPNLVSGSPETTWREGMLGVVLRARSSAVFRVGGAGDFDRLRQRLSVQ
jgi:alpha-galactosidase